MLYWNDVLFPEFLRSIDSDAYHYFTLPMLQRELESLAKKAITRFKFSKIKLDYEYDGSIIQDGETGCEIPHGYYFVQNLGYEELVVILAWMKVYWMEYFTSQEELMQRQYTDKDIKEFSSGNMVNSINKAYDARLKDAIRAEKDYYRVNKEGNAALGDINV